MLLGAAADTILGPRNDTDLNDENGYGDNFKIAFIL
jgi:hypothetical protein